MSPPEGEEPTTATAEPEAPETPQLGEQPSPTEEAVPAAEQEQPEGEKPEGDSETQEQEEEAPSLEQTVEALGPLLNELKESNPDLAKALGLGEGDTDRLAEQEHEFTKREVEQAKTDRQSTLSRATEAAGGFTSQNIQQQALAYGKRIAEDVEKEAGALLKKTDIEAGDTRLLDGDTVAQDISTYITSAVLAWNTYSGEQHSATVFDALEGDDAHGHLTADEKRTLREGRSKPLAERINEALPIYLGAARRSAPEVKGKADAKQTAAKQKLADTVGKIAAIIPKNGAQKMTPAGGQGQPRNETEARNLHATGKWTDRQMREYLARPKA